VPDKAPAGPLWRPSPNAGARRDDARPDLIVLHYTAMTSAAAALNRLCDPDAAVSAHYLIGRDGTVWQLVPEARRAWHAGAGCWGRVRDVNSRSIGIELDNDGRAPFSAPLMAALERLLPDPMARWGIPPDRVIGHADVAPERKADPGPRFDWRRLARQGLAVWPRAGFGGADDAGFRDAATAFGYGRNWTDPAVLAAFRARFRPGAQGPEDAVDRALIGDLARRFPVDRGARGS